MNAQFKPQLPVEFCDINEIELNAGQSGYLSPALIGYVEVVLAVKVPVYMQHELADRGEEQEFSITADCDEAYREQVEYAAYRKIKGLP